MGFHIHVIQVIVGSLAALLLFQRGFLITRVVINEKSRCSDVVSSGNFCWIPAQFNRTIWLIIDGLRFDFIDPSDFSGSPEEVEAGFFRGQMPNTAHLIRTEPEKARLFRFIADAPTTTFQRLKALTTGIVPAFIEAGNNFDGEEVLDDNLIGQISSGARNATLLGDDTWTKLFPKGFGRQHAVPSFDIKDLDEVDDVVIGEVEMEVKRDDWSFLVAHCLGVDHCGHRYGPAHKEMSRKLRQMDRLVANLAEWMQEDTILIVMGDHGMTRTGDHGGGSRDEITAGLFAYTKRPGIFSNTRAQAANTWSTVNQMDIVPTISLLLDMPIPFSSIGILIEELMPEHILVKAAKLNTAQMIRYATAYGMMGNQDLENQLQQLLRSFNRLNTDEDLEVNLATMRQIQSLFRTSLNEYDEPLALMGLLSMLDALLYIVNVLMARERSGQEEKVPSRFPTAMLVFRSAICLLQLAAYYTPTARGEITDRRGAFNALLLVLVSSVSYQLLQGVLHSATLLSRNLSEISIDDVWCIALVVFHSLSFLSNSYILYEADFTKFVLQCAVFASLYEGLKRSSIPKRGILANLKGNRQWHKSIVRHFLCMSALRAGQFFQTCREEQVSCLPDSVWSAKSMGIGADTSRAATATGLSILSLNLFNYYANSRNHFFGKTPSVFYKLLSWAMTIAVNVHWLCELIPPQHELFTTGSRRSALLVYTLFLAQLAWGIAFIRRDAGVLVWLRSTLPILLSMILGSFLTPSLMLLIVALELWSSDDNEVHSGSRRCATEAFFITTISSYSFYTLGHQSTFTAIPWEAAFIGVPGNFSIRWIPALLLLLHLYAGHLISITYTVSTRMNSNRRDTIFLYLFAFFVSKLLGCCIAGFIHRRHLMSSKVFAPKFVYEAVAYLFTCLFICATLLVRYITPHTREHR